MNPKLEEITLHARNVSDFANSAHVDCDLRAAIVELADAVTALAHVVAEVDAAAKRAANIASCLANGINPD